MATVTQCDICGKIADAPRKIAQNGYEIYVEVESVSSGLDVCLPCLNKLIKDHIKEAKDKEI